jgi:phage tail-like protein
MSFPAAVPMFSAASSAVSPTDILGLNNRFHVKIDDIDLGHWGQCKGLEVDFGTKPIDQGVGGIYDYEVYLPGQVKYTPISLRRAVNPQDSMKVQGWLRSQMTTWVHGANAGPGGTGAITLFSSDSKPVMTWSLRGVYPSKWTGPELDAMTAGIAMETLVFVHQGFL